MQSYISEADPVSSRICFEKSETVLWAPKPAGIVLHNFAERAFLDLDGFDYLVWSYLDGTRTLEEIAAAIVQSGDSEYTSIEAAYARAALVFDELLAAGCVTERRS